MPQAVRLEEAPISASSEFAFPVESRKRAYSISSPATKLQLTDFQDPEHLTLTGIGLMIEWHLKIRLSTHKCPKKTTLFSR